MQVSISTRSQHRSNLCQKKPERRSQASCLSVDLTRQHKLSILKSGRQSRQHIAVRHELASRSSRAPRISDCQHFYYSTIPSRQKARSTCDGGFRVGMLAGVFLHSLRHPPSEASVLLIGAG